MRVKQLSLTDFRSYTQADITFGPGVTTLVGRNGQGKTNVVEAVRYLSVLNSHRVAVDAPMIRHGADDATIRANVEKAGRSLTVEVTLSGGRANTARVNRSNVRPREIVGILRSVVFAPEDLALVKGDPTDRRRMLDDLCVVLSPPLAGDYSDYERVVRQRATLLKSARGKPTDLGTLDVWDEKLAKLGATIVRARLDAVAALEPLVAATYSDIAPDEGACRITYESSSGGADLGGLDHGALEMRLLERLAEVRGKELERGVCLVGPHRDDLTIRLGELPAKGYASHGEAWSCALALRLATYDLLTAEGGPDADADGEPVLILDDVFAELDESRRDALARRAARAQQVIVTAAVSQDVPDVLAGDILRVSEGRVARDGDG